jgi:hypothetical protein
LRGPAPADERTDGEVRDRRRATAVLAGLAAGWRSGAAGGAGRRGRWSMPLPCHTPARATCAHRGMLVAKYSGVGRRHPSPLGRGVLLTALRTCFHDLPGRAPGKRREDVRDILVTALRPVADRCRAGLS